MNALIHFGFDPNRELPIVSQIKEDVKKLNNKELIFKKITQIERQLNFESDKKRLIWNEEDEEQEEENNNNNNNNSKISKIQKAKNIEIKPSLSAFNQNQINIQQSNSSSFLLKLINDTEKKHSIQENENNEIEFVLNTNKSLSIDLISSNEQKNVKSSNLIATGNSSLEKDTIYE